MVKKAFGGLFFAGALFLLIGAISNGTLFSDKGSAAATYGTFLGTIIPVVLYVFSGIFLFTFDDAAKMSYIDGFKKRSKQSSKFVVFIAAYGVLLLFAAIGAGAAGAGYGVLGYIMAFLPYLIPLLVFVVFMQMYAQPHQASAKHFLNSDAALNYYLSNFETFYTYSSDGYVLASNKALFFPELFCVIPFDQISSITLTKQLWEQDVYFYLSNGKKFYIVTKHYDRIMEAMNANNRAWH